MLYSFQLSKTIQHPTNPSTVYVLTAGGGLWRTYNFFEATGPTWTPLTDFLVTTSGGCVAFGRSPSTIYLALGDPYQRVGVGGIFVISYDGGDTWTAPVSLSGTDYVYEVKVDTTQSVDIILITDSNGIHRSSDGGLTFSIVYSSPAYYGSTYSIVKTSIGWIAYDYTDGILVSYNLGVTWIKGLTNWASVSTATGYQAARATLAVAVAGDSTVFAYTARSSDNHQLDLFRSKNGGLTWTALGCNSNKIPTNPDSSESKELLFDIPIVRSISCQVIRAIWTSWVIKGGTIK